MKDYPSSKIRNIVILGHGSNGKTTLAEAMLYNTGVLDRLGKVSDGNTTTDFDPEETKRKISISTALAFSEWSDCKINIIDAPGYFDFVGEVMESIRVADTAVIVASGKSGISVGTENSWKYAEDNGIAKFIFVSKLDEENSNFDKVAEQLKDKYGSSVVPFVIPVMKGEKVAGYVDTIKGQGFSYDGKKVASIPLPDDIADKLEEIKEQLNEAIAETSEDLMEKYFSGESFTEQEFINGLKNGVRDGSIVPVFCGSALDNKGIDLLMNGIVEYAPSPDSMGDIECTDMSGNAVSLKPTADESLSALVFKTVADPYVGKLSYFKVFSGTLTSDSPVYNSTSDSNEKMAHIFIVRGKKQIEVNKLIAGDIGAVTKLNNVNTGDTLCNPAKQVILKGIDFPSPCLSLAIVPKAKGDEEKISNGLHKLREEDPTIKVENNSETGQMLISGIGEQHLDIIVSKLKNKFNVAVELIDPKVPYRETIKKKVKVEGKHKKQSGGHGQFGHVWIEFEPGDSEDLIFEEKIFGGSVPKNYFPAVEKGLRESILQGVLAGYPVVNLKAVLVDGSYHPVDSSEMAFKMAASLAYKKGVELASPVLLEPIGKLEVYVPDSYMGDIIGDINKRRGQVLGMNPQDGGIQQVVAEVPMAEMHKYATDLRSMTQARGSFKIEFERYQEAPMQVAQKIIDEYKVSKA